MNATAQLNQWRNKDVVVTLLVSKGGDAVTIRGTLTEVDEDALLITASSVGTQMIMRQAIATIHLAAEPGIRSL